MYSLINIQSSHRHTQAIYIHMYSVYLCCSFIKRKGERYTPVAPPRRLATSSIFAAFVQFCVRLKCRWAPRDKCLPWPGPRRNLTNRNQDKLWVRARCYMGVCQRVCVCVCVFMVIRSNNFRCAEFHCRISDRQGSEGAAAAVSVSAAWAVSSMHGKGKVVVVCAHAVIDTIRIRIPIPFAQHRL